MQEIHIKVANNCLADVAQLDCCGMVLTNQNYMLGEVEGGSGG
jgi:hypothetical protein